MGLRGGVDTGAEVVTVGSSTTTCKGAIDGAGPGASTIRSLPPSSARMVAIGASADAPITSATSSSTGAGAGATSSGATGAVSCDATIAATGVATGASTGATTGADTGVDTGAAAIGADPGASNGTITGAKDGAGGNTANGCTIWRGLKAAVVPEVVLAAMTEAAADGR